MTARRVTGRPVRARRDRRRVAAVLPGGLGGGAATAAVLRARARRARVPRLPLRARLWDATRSTLADWMGKAKTTRLGRRGLERLFRTRFGQRLMLEMI
jgi:hypothetical protein